MLLLPCTFVSVLKPIGVYDKAPSFFEKKKKMSSCWSPWPQLCIDVCFVRLPYCRQQWESGMIQRTAALGGGCVSWLLLLLLLLAHTVQTLQTLVVVLGWNLTKPWGSSVAIRCLPGWHLSEIPPTHSFLPGLCGATLYLVLWSSLPSENLPAANWPQHIKSFTLISFFGSTGRYTGLLWLFDSALNFWLSLFSKPHLC